MRESELEPDVSQDNNPLLLKPEREEYHTSDSQLNLHATSDWVRLGSSLSADIVS